MCQRKHGRLQHHHHLPSLQTVSSLVSSHPWSTCWDWEIALRKVGHRVSLQLKVTVNRVKSRLMRTVRAKRSLGNTSRGNPKNEPDPSDGVASSSGGILDMIQAIDEKREKVQANGAPSQIAADPTSRPKARSLYPALPDGPETYPFDEGRLKSGRPSPTPPPGGTEVEPIEISDSESSSPSSSSSSSSHRPSSIPTPPLTSTPNATRRPSRPNLRGHVPPKRQYSWMQPAPDSPASTQSRHDMTRKRDLRIRKERGKTQKLKKTASQHQLNRIAMATEGGGDQVQQAGKRVSKMMEMSSSGSRNEKTFAAGEFGSIMAEFEAAMLMLVQWRNIWGIQN